jgi:hypothetical protein
MLVFHLALVLFRLETKSFTFFCLVVEIKTFDFKFRPYYVVIEAADR